MMDLQEGKSAFLQQLESKKNSFRKAILMIARESKVLDEHLDLTKESFNECVADLNLKQKKLDCYQNSIAESNRELESHLKEIECREVKFQSFQQTQLEEIMVKEGQLAEIRTWVVGKLQEVELKEERLIEQTKSMEALLQKFRQEKQEFEDIQKSVGEKMYEISVRERKIEDRSKELYSVQDWIEKRAKELDSKEENVKMRERLSKKFCQELGNKVQELDFTRKLIQERSEKLDLKEEQLKMVQNLLERKLEDQSNILERKSKELEEQLNAFESRKKPLEEQCKQLEAKEKQFAEWLKYFELKQYEEMSKDFDSKEKQLEEKSTEIVSNGQLKDTLALLDLPAGVVSMDGRCLQLYLNEHFENYESLSGVVSQILLLSRNPGKLVLDAMEGFYPPHLRKGQVEFATNVVRRSCIFLLEQLMIISPQIRPNLKKRALTLADEWKMKIEVLSRSPLEVLAFILLLATFKLTFNFDANEILQLLWAIPSHKHVPQLCTSLGLRNKVPEFIRTLIERRLHLEAIEYVCAFDLVDEFPPATLLEGYISYEEEATGKILEEGMYSVKAREIACRKELNALIAVMSCIKLHKLECQSPVGKIKERIEQLKSRRIYLGTRALYPSLEARLEERFDSQTEERATKKHKGLFFNMPSTCRGMNQYPFGSPDFNSM